MKRLPAQIGWGIIIRRKADGSEFLCASGTGDGSPVWAKCNRRYAVAHKKELRKHGFDARVVPVAYATPMVLTDH
jgi:hypothetical protein